MLVALQRALASMIEHPSLSLRDRAILLLLRHTGARAHEILGMTAGGYRSFTPRGILGQAYVADKGSGGQEIKRIDFAAAPEVQRALLRYLAQERPAQDPFGRVRLADLPDRAPLFLTAAGTPYSYMAFRWHWRRVYRQARGRCPVDFSIHDIRHLHVTELLLLARGRYGKGSPTYEDQKQAISRLMGWQGAQTIETYDHSLDEVEALGLLAELQRAIAAKRGGGAVPAREGGTGQQAVAAQDQSAGDTAGISDEPGGGTPADAGALAWVEGRVRRGLGARQGEDA